jgi:archaemetzincin
VSDVEILELDDVPPGIGAKLLARLGRPFAGGSVARSRVDLEPLRDRARGQVDAARLVERLPRPTSARSLLALTSSDLFLPVLTYVFGLSELGGRRGVLSLARLRPEAAPREPPERTEERLLRRVTVEAMHELGHTLGLVHCPVQECPMRRILWPEALDIKGTELCPSCLLAAGAALRR